MRDLNHLNLSDLKSICKYYKLSHKSRVKRAELEALIFLAEVSFGLSIIDEFNSVFDVSGLDVSGSPSSL